MLRLGECAPVTRIPSKKWGVSCLMRSIKWSVLVLFQLEFIRDWAFSVRSASCICCPGSKTT